VREQKAVHFEEFFPPLEMWIDVSAYPSENGLSVYFKDSTEKKWADENIRIAKERYDIVARVTNDAVWDWNIITNDVHWGEGFQTLFGYDPTKEPPSLELWDSRIHPDDRQRVIENVEWRLISGDTQVIDVEYRFLKADGTYADVLDRGFVMRDMEGKATRVIGSMKDITESKAAKVSLEKSERGLKQAQEISHIGNWEHDFIENRSIWSHETYRILDIEPDTPPSLEIYLALIHKDDIDEVMQVIREMEKQMQPRSFTHRIVRKDGSLRTLYCESRFVFSHSGKTISVYGVLHDITERKQQELELKKLNDELFNSNRELERFAYIASHDLQEPLRMVSSFLQLLKKKYGDQLDEAADQYINFAVDGADRMKQLILDLLEYSRIGTNKEVVISTDVNETINEVLKDLGNKILESNALITVQPMPVISANKTQLRQLIQNLVGNALKYNKSSPPEIEIGAEGRSDSWQFFVKDNGIGIDPKHFDKVFEIFKRLHNKSEFSGTGLGLAICKKIVERHDGKIWVESKPGTGSTFFFTIRK
jgi:PAS domain S-box-containing protein